MPDPVASDNLAEWIRHGITAVMSAGGTFGVHRWIRMRDEAKLLEELHSISEKVDLVHSDMASLKATASTKFAELDKVQALVDTHIHDHVTGQLT